MADHTEKMKAPLKDITNRITQKSSPVLKTPKTSHRPASHLNSVILAKDLKNFSDLSISTPAHDHDRDDSSSSESPVLHKVGPKHWFFSGRYMSPTDQYLSPISQRLLKDRKAGLSALVFSQYRQVRNDSIRASADESATDK